MPLPKRIGLLILVLMAYCLYIPTNHFSSGGVMIKIPLDIYIPIIPIFAIPYLLTLPFGIFAYLWSAWKMKDGLFRAFISSTFVTVLTGAATFLVFPTYIERPILAGQDIGTQLLHFLYSVDGTYNAFPSQHVYLIVLIALFWSRWYPRWRWLLASMVIIVSLSTLFTGQHYILDPIGGVLIAWFGYRIGCNRDYKTVTFVTK